MRPQGDSNSARDASLSRELRVFEQLYEWRIAPECPASPPKCPSTGHMEATLCA
jgi:hypothetical protein